MPIYEYECSHCSHRLEMIQKISDKPLRKCPECGQNSLSKLVSAAGFRLGGKGWYETDFKNGNKRNLKEGGNGDAAAPAAKEPAKEQATGKATGKTKVDVEKPKTAAPAS